MFRYFIVILLFSINLFAVEQSEYVEMARTRKYIGGADESDLKVQVVLYQSPNKKKKQIKVEPNEGF